MYYYRLNADTEAAGRLRQLLNAINQAQRAQVTFLKNIGAEGFKDDEERLMAGGVLCVSFPDDKKVDERIWRQAHKDLDGVQMWVPNVERRTGCIILPRRGFQPSDTWCRVYSKRPWSWAQSMSQYTLKEWAQMAGVTLTGDKERDAERVTAELKDADFGHYTEFYHRDWDPQVLDKKVRIPWWVREAVRLEVQIAKLPQVPISMFYRLMQAESPVPAGQTHAVVSEMLPNFFELAGRYYISSSRPLRAEGLEEINRQKYAEKEQPFREAERIGDSKPS